MEMTEEEQEAVHEEEELYEESTQKEQGDLVAEEDVKQDCEKKKNKVKDLGGNRFIHGLSVGLGIGCITTFVILWVSVFFTPQLAQSVTYDKLLSIFVFPLIYLLAIGLIALTAGIVREYYSTRRL